MFDFGIVTNWIDELLNGFMPSWLATTVECALVGVMLLVMYSLLAIFYIFYERKVCAWFQCRLGPMRVGPWGVLQVFADVIKILLKELITLWNTDRLLFALAPYLVIVASFLVFACLVAERDWHCAGRRGEQQQIHPDRRHAQRRADD